MVRALCARQLLADLVSASARVGGQCRFKADDGKVLQWSSRRIVRHAEDTSPWLKRAAAEVRDAARARDFGLARGAFDRAGAKTAQLYDVLLRAAVQCSCFREGLAVLDEMRAEGLQPTARTFVTAVRLHAKLGQQAQAAEAWEQALAAGLPQDLVHDAYLAAIAASAEAGDVSGALARLAELDARLDAAPGTAHFGAALHACARVGARTEARTLLGDMRRRGVRRSTVCYTQALRAMRGAPLAEVYAVTALMERDGLRADEQALEAQLEALLGRPLGEVADAPAARALERARLNAAAAALRAARQQGVLLKATARRLEDALAGAGILGVGGP